uniref:Uncharacterized protein n=1 Tax=Romanomermis culicivorax TaxID=13658 RepID=A0A915KTC1_ROMCU
MSRKNMALKQSKFANLLPCGREAPEVPGSRVAQRDLVPLLAPRATQKARNHAHYILRLEQYSTGCLASAYYLRVDRVPQLPANIIALFTVLCIKFAQIRYLVGINIFRRCLRFAGCWSSPWAIDPYR